MTKYTKTELIREIETLKQQLREREQNYTLEPFGGGYCSDPC